MALISKWPQDREEFYNNKQWEAKNWSIGEPITKEKLQKMDDGIAILATQIKAILGEFNPSSLDGAQLNASRLDKVQEWITGSSSTTYSGTNIIARLSGIDTLNEQQNNKLSAIMSEIGGTGSDGSNSTYGGTSRIDSIATEIWGSNTVSGTSRIDKNDNKIAAIAAELGGTAPDGNSTTYGGTTRLDTVISKASSIATEIWGSDTTSGDSRIDKLTTELYGSNVTDYNTTSKLDSTITKLSTITTELYGSDNTSITSRLDDLEKELCGSTITRDTTNGGYLNSRIDNIESVNSTQNTEITNLKTRATSIEDVNTTQNSRLTALENELSGSGTGTTGSSRLDNIQTWITGSNSSSYESGKAAIMTRLNSLETSRTTDEAAIGTLQTDNTTNKTNISSIITKNNEQDNNISKIKIEVWGPNKDYDDSSRIDDLNSRTSTVESLSTSNQGRISAAESRIERIEGGAIAAKIFNYTTTNTTASDSLTLSTNSLIDQNSIVMVFLNAATLGTNNLTIKDSANIAYNIKINNQTNSNLKAKFAAGSLLGLYRGTTNEVYLFNAPLAI